jgi:hypothetical protein
VRNVCENCDVRQGRMTSNDGQALDGGRSSHISTFDTFEPLYIGCLPMRGRELFSLVPDRLDGRKSRRAQRGEGPEDDAHADRRGD